MKHVDLSSEMITIPLSTFLSLQRDSVALNELRATSKPASMLSQADVMRILDVSRTTLYTLRRSGDFPAPVSGAGIGLKWFAHEIEAWAEARRRAY